MPVGGSETISGRLVGPDGSPVAGTVRYRSFADRKQSGAAECGKDGTFLLKGLEVGHYQLTGEATSTDWASHSEVVQAGAADVSLTLLPSWSFTGKVRTSLAARALGEEPSVEVVGQPNSLDADASRVVAGADRTFALTQLGDASCVIYATTESGWISRPHVAEEANPSEKAPTFVLREGGRLELAGVEGALWTWYQISDDRDWITHLHLAPGEERTVTVPRGEVGVFCEVCQRDPSEAPGVDLEGGCNLTIKRGGVYDLTDPAELFLEAPEQSSMMALVLMKGEEAIVERELSAALATSFPTASEGEPDAEESVDAEAADATVVIELESGSLLAVSHFLFKIPGDEAARGANASPFWPNGAVEAAAHGSNIAVFNLGSQGSPVDRALDLTRAVQAVLEVAGDRALGVLWGSAQPAATRADLFSSLVADASRENLPLNVWVRFQMVLTEDSDNRGLYTSGLRQFDLMEVEVPPCSTPYEQVFDAVLALAHYLVTQGPVIGDGDTIGGPGEEPVRITYGPSMVFEGAEVYTLNLK
jgi:hypothetical protein